MEKRYRYQIEKRTGSRGLLSTVLAACSLALLLALLTACAALDGQAGRWAGALGFTGMMAALAGVVAGLQSFRDRQRSYGLSKAGTIMSGVLVAVWFLLFCRGLAA